jgi:hypothetical protein
MRWCWLFVLLGCRAGAVPLAPAPPVAMPADDDALLARFQRDAFAYFWFESDARTGLTKDRAGTLAPDDCRVASIAATGFALSALVIGAERGWVPREAAVARAALTLRFVRDKVRHERGFLPHFLDLRTGARVWDCEYSSVDTALFLAGALTAGAAFGGEVAKLANALHERLDWPWLVSPDKLIRHGWKPDQGFLRPCWDTYSETVLVNLLALGHPTRPVEPGCWAAWRRTNQGEYAGLRVFAGGLFIANYNGAYVDWRGRRDPVDGTDYHSMASAGVLANRAFCLDQAKDGRFGYDEAFWGLSATDAPDGGYRAYQGPLRPVHDGTICPWAVAGAVPFAPEICVRSLRQLVARYGAGLYGRYGFVGAAHRARNWARPDVIGIDVGAGLVMLENHRSGLVWRLFASLPSTQAAFARAGFAPAP